MNNKQREGGYWDTPHGLLAQVENLCALEHELIFSEISELASRAREAMLTPPAPSDWETELDDAAESAAGMESVTGAAYWVAKKAKDILRRALATRPGVDVECDHVFVGDHTEEGGVMCVKCGVDIYDTPPAPSDWEDEWYGEDGFVYPEMQAFFEANAEGNGYSLNVTDIPEMLDMAVRRALASRPALTVEDVISQGIESWARPYRFDERYHLGLGDIRVTPWMLDDLADRIKAAITEGEK